jgi:hypothetical protein
MSRSQHQSPIAEVLMSRRFFPAVLLGLVLAFVALVLFSKPDASAPSQEQLRTDKEMLAKEAAEGSEDDPEARARFEWMKYHDPATGQIPEDIRSKELEFARTIPSKEEFRQRISERGGSLAKLQSFTWNQRGPRNVGGRTRALGVDITNGTTILAGGVSGGMWKSTDEGSTWVKTSTPGQLHSVTTLAQDTRAGKTSTWYYGTGEYLGNSASLGGGSYRGDGIFKSTDNGSSWSVLASTSTNAPQLFDNFFDYVWRVAVDPSNASQDEVYAATYGAIWRSTDGGTNWSPVRGGSTPYSSYTDVTVTSTGVVYGVMSSSGSQPGCWRSTDGVSWANITPAGFPTTYNRIVLAVAPSNENVVYFLLQQPDTTTNASQVRGHQLWKYTYLTGDGSGSGGSWVNRGGNLPLEAGLAGNARFDSQGGYDMWLQVKPDNENFLIVGAINLYRSTDAFATNSNWLRIGGYPNPTSYGNYPNHHCDQHSGAFKPGSPSVYFSGNDGGVSKTSNVTAGVVNWTSLNNGYQTSQFYTVAIDQASSGNAEVIGGTQDNGTWWTNSSSGSVSWIDEFSGDGAFCAIANGRTYYYLSSQNGNMYRVQWDGSGNWTTWANVQPTGGGGYLFINPFALDPNNSNMMYLAGGDRIWRNTDLTAVPAFQSSTTAVNWTALSNSVVTGQSVSAVAPAKSPANRLYYATTAGNVYRMDNANTGQPTRTTITGASFPASSYVNCIAVDPTNADDLIVVFSNYSVVSLWHSTDGGTSWTAVSGNLEQNPDGTGNGPSINWVAIVPYGGTTTYFAGTSTGLYSTTALSGASTAWVQEGSTTIGNVVVDMVVSRPLDGLVVAATHANGMYSATVVTSAEEIAQVPRTFALEQNYPNPFNPSTTIRYALPELSQVRLSVFDLQGREIALLESGSRNQGIHQTVWNGLTSSGQPAPSGVYFYRLEAVGSASGVNFGKTEKMMLLK